VRRDKVTDVCLYVATIAELETTIKEYDAANKVKKA
jgi:hypothetical protein